MAKKLSVCSTTSLSAQARFVGILRAFAVLSILALATPSGWAQGLQPRPCPLSGGGTSQAYMCRDDIVVVDGSGYNATGFPNGTKVGGLYFVDRNTGNQTPISTGGYLNQAASVAIEPVTGKLLAVTRTYGVIRVDPKDGSQEVLLRGGTGWGKPFPTFDDSAHNNVSENFIYPGAISIDPADNSVLVTDTGFNLFDTTLLSGAPNCTTNDVRSCEHLPGKIIRLKKGQGAGVYSGIEVVAKGGSLSAPFDLVVDSSSIYATDMIAKLGGTADPGVGGIINIYLDPSDPGAGFKQNTVFSAYASNTSTTTGCPMGITLRGNDILATVFTYNGYGCSPQAVFTVTPDPFGIKPATMTPIVNGYPFQYPFGMDPDRNGIIIVADEGSGYGCAGTIFLLDLTKPIVTSGSLSDLNPFALSPIAGSPDRCTPPHQTYLSTPSDVAAVKVLVSVNIATNTPPSNVSVSMSPSTINENDGTSVSGTFADPDTSDTHTVTITWGDGSSDTVLNLAAGVLTIPATTHQYLDNLPSNAAYTVTVLVADAKANATGTTDATVNNVAPAISGVSGPSGTIDLGGLAIINASFIEVGTLDSRTCIFSWKDGQPDTTVTPAGTGNGSCTASHTYNSSGDFNVGVTVKDKDGGSSSSTTKVTVNTPPAIASLGLSPSVISENGSTILSGTFTDPDTSETHTVTITWGDGSPDTVLNLAAGVLTIPATTHQYLDNLPSNAAYTVTVVVADPKANATGTTNVTVNNVAPAISGVSGPSGTIALGGVASIGANFTDVGTLDSHTCIVSWGDGQPDTTVTPSGTGNGSCTASHVYNSSGGFNVGVTVKDKDGGSSSSSAKVTVNTAPAIVSLGLSPSVISENGSTVLSGTFTDPDANDTHGVTINWGDGSANTVISRAAGILTFSLGHQYLDNNSPSNTYTISVGILDSLGASTGGNTSVTVTNANPVITSTTGPTAPAILGSSTTTKVNFTDAGTLDTHTCNIKWGDNTTSTASATETNGSGSCTQTHTYANDGVYSVEITVTDNNGGIGTSKFNYVVIYDPAKATVIGSGSFVSPAGAVANDTSLAGPATFGFLVKYTNGVIDPTSYKQFSFDLANLHFNSYSIDSFVGSGPNAQFHGTGTMNSDGRSWTFLVTVTDGQQPGGGGADKYRLKLTDDAGLLVYDNVRGAPDDINFANPEPISSGQITVLSNTSNTPPAVSSLALNSTEINEGAAVTLTGTFTDPDAGQTHTVVVDWGDGTAGTTVSVSAGSSNFAVPHFYKDNPKGASTFTIGVKVMDSTGAVGTGSTSVSVNNVPPVLRSLIGPPLVVAIGTAATLKGIFTDIGFLDTHSCAVGWGDGQTSSGTASETNGSGTCTASHVYSVAGAWLATFTVYDKDGASASSTYKLTVK